MERTQLKPLKVPLKDYGTVVDILQKNGFDCPETGEDKRYCVRKTVGGTENIEIVVIPDWGVVRG